MSTDVACPPEIVNGILDLLHRHPIVTAIVLVLIGVAVALSIGLVILLRTKEMREFVKDLVSLRRASALSDERDQAVAERDAAAVALKSVTAEAELAKLALGVAEDTVERFNALGDSPNLRARSTARIHLLDWIQRVFGFTQSDINKVTLWIERPDDAGFLRPYTATGISPESFERLRLPIAPSSENDDSFAAMAYRSHHVEVCDDTENDRRYNRLGRAPKHPYRSLMAAPIIKNGAVVGVLTIDSLFIGTFAGRDARRLSKLSVELVTLLFGDDATPSANVRWKSEVGTGGEGERAE